MATAHIALLGGVAIRSPSNCNSLAPIASSSSSSSWETTRCSAAHHHRFRSNGPKSMKLSLSADFGAECWRRSRSRRIGRRWEGGGWIVKAQAGSAAMVAKEMERVAAKEALLLSIKDAGGLKGLSDPAANDEAKLDVNEKILILERLNPTPRPTTSPILDGLWQFEWAGARSPGVVAARTLLGRFPTALASIDSLTLLIFDGTAKATGILKIFNMIESSFTLSTKLSVKGPLRLKEDYVEGLFATPTLPEGSIPSQLKGVVDQFVAAVERLPNAVKDVVTDGLKLPLTGTFTRVLLISYLDEELMVARDKSGVPDVLLRLDIPVTDSSADVIAPEYMS